MGQRRKSDFFYDFLIFNKTYTLHRELNNYILLIGDVSPHVHCPSIVYVCPNSPSFYNVFFMCLTKRINRTSNTEHGAVEGAR